MGSHLHVQEAMTGTICAIRLGIVSRAYFWECISVVLLGVRYLDHHRFISILEEEVFHRDKTATGDIF